MTKKCDGKTVKSEKCKIKLSLPNLNIGQERQCSILSTSSFPQIFKLKHGTNLHESIHIMSIFLSKKYFTLFAHHSSSGLQLSHRLSSETQFESLPWSFYPALSQIPKFGQLHSFTPARRRHQPPLSQAFGVILFLKSLPAEQEQTLETQLFLILLSGNQG